MSTKIDSPTHLAQPKNKINKGGLGRAELRAEVLAERTNQWLGKTKLAMPVVFWLYSGTALVLATLVLTFLIFGSYAQTELASGIIGPKGGPKKVNVEKEGEVTSVYVHEGDRVSAGDPLFQIRLSTTVAKSDILASSGSETVGQNKLETIKAPVGGLIYAFSLNVGDNVLPSSSEPPITIAEDGALVTQIAVSVSAQARLSVGSLVMLELVGDKNSLKSKLEAKVVAVAVRPDEGFNLATGSTTSSYKVWLELDSQVVASDELLGKQISVKITLEKRKLYQWLLDPLRTLFGS